MYYHIWLAYSFNGFAFKWLFTVVLYGLEVYSNTKTYVGQPHYFNRTIKLLGSKDLGTNVFRTLMFIVGKP